MTPLRWATTHISRHFGTLRDFAGLYLGRQPGRRPQARTATGPLISLRLHKAYRTLGLTPDAGEDLVRTTFRRHMNRSHPDKLAARGATETELKAAQQNTYELRKAYDLIRKMYR